MADAMRPPAPDDVLTGDELLRMPQLDPCELVDGRIRPMTPTNADHGRIELNVAAALRAFARSQNLGTVMVGEVGVFTSRNPDTVRAADVLFLSHASSTQWSRSRGYLDVAPELVVEVLSPDQPIEVQQKVTEYLAPRVRAVCLGCIRVGLMCSGATSVESPRLGPQEPIVPSPQFAARSPNRGRGSQG